MTKILLLYQRLQFCRSFGANRKDSWRLILFTLKYSIAVRSKSKNHQLQSDDQVHQIQARYSGKTFPLYFRRQDLSMLYEVWMDKCYTIENKSVAIGDILDIGAHVGFTTLYFWSQLGNHRHYICIEGSDKNANVLKQNIKSIPQTTIHQSIVTKDGRQVRFYNEMSGHLHTVHDTLGYLVDSESLNTIISKNHDVEIALCKMDIEGMETEILTHNNKWLKRVKQLFLELHNPKEYNLLEKSLAKMGLIAGKDTLVKHFIKYSDQPQK